jgi:chromate transporter
MYIDKEENKNNLKENLISTKKENEFINRNKKKIMTLGECTKICIYLGFISFGGPIAHIGVFKKILIEENNFLSDLEFTDLFNICNIIPGPTSSQLLTAIMTLKTNSVIGGLISFLCFNMPALIAMIIIANLFQQNKFIIDEFTNITPANFDNYYIIYLFIMGICQAAVSNILLAAFTLSDKIKNNLLQIILLISATITFSFTGNLIAMILIMIICGLITILNGDESMLLKLVYEDSSIENKENLISIEDSNIIKNKNMIDNESKLPFFLGLPALITWGFFIKCFLLIKFFNLNFFLSEKNLIISEAFFRIGSVIVGGGHVVIPMMMIEFVETNLISRDEVLKGFSFVSLMPGPMFNITGYIGTLINGTLTGFLSAFFIFLPGMLIMFFMIGNLKVLNNHKNIQFFIRGASTAGIGFIFTAVFTIFMETTINSNNSNLISGLINIGICFYLMKKTTFLLPFILLIGALNYIFLRFISFYIYK